MDMTSPCGGLGETAAHRDWIVIAETRVRRINPRGAWRWYYGWSGSAVYRSSPDCKRPGLRLPSSDGLRGKRRWYGSWA